MGGLNLIVYSDSSKIKCCCLLMQILIPFSTCMTKFLLKILTFYTGNDFYGSSKKGRRKAHKLLVHVCDCLYKCFLYDTEGFVTKERFDTLLQPLVDQVTDIYQSDSCFCQALVTIPFNFTCIVNTFIMKIRDKQFLFIVKLKFDFTKQFKTWGNENYSTSNP